MKKNKNIAVKVNQKRVPIVYKLASDISGNRYRQFKLLIQFILNSRFNFFFINAVSLSRFAFDREMLVRNKAITNKRRKKKTKSLYVIKRFEKERRSRFRNVAIFIKNLVRISFFCIYIKKAQFLAQFYAFTLQKLPRNRKETIYIQCLIKLLKVVSTQRVERLGLRLVLKGRLNRWRRTKRINGIKGSLIYITYKSRIDFGIAQAITRKGAQGIRIWFCYKPEFSGMLKKAIFKYFKLSTTIIKKKNVSTNSASFSKN